MDHEPVTLDLFGVAWRLGATVFFVLLNGFFVTTEFALVKVRGSRIDELATRGRGAAKGVQHTLAHLDRYLSACQLGITLASLALGALGEPAVSVLLMAAARSLGGTLAAEPPWLPIVSIGVAFTVITTLHMTLGEQAPKMWALRRAEATALRTSFALRSFTWVFGPFIMAVNTLSNWILRASGLDPGEMHEASHTAEEVRSILSLSARAGHISERELELTENVFRMIDLEVRHIIVPRVDVSYLSLDRSLEENLERVRESRHSRLPLCEVGLDSVVGFIHAKDVLERALLNEPPELQALARPPLFVPDTMSVSNFLLELQSNQAHCAVVVDEHGTAIGLAFREDALEEIVGPLGDEFDEQVSGFREVAAGRYELAGNLSLPEVCDRLDFELGEDEDEHEETIGGHVTARLGRMPRRGDTTLVGPYQATVLEVSRRRIQRLRMTLLEPAEDGEGAAQVEEDAP